MFSCSKCSFSTKYKGNLERHDSKCNGEKPKITVYCCDVCSSFTTRNKAHLTKHQESDICKKRSQETMTLEQEVKCLRKQVAIMWEWFENREKTKEEKQQEEEMFKNKIRRDLTKHGIPWDVGDTLDGLRHLRQTQIYDKLKVQT